MNEVQRNAIICTILVEVLDKSDSFSMSCLLLWIQEVEEHHQNMFSTIQYFYFSDLSLREKDIRKISILFL